MGNIKIALLASVLLLIGIVVFLWQTGFRSQPHRTYSGPVEKVTVGIDYSGYNALLWIAQDRGFDRAHGLELNLKTFQSGKEAIANLSTGGLVLACCTEFVLVLRRQQRGYRPARPGHQPCGRFTGQNHRCAPDNIGGVFPGKISYFKPDWPW
jgi:ABC-type nitrate/sulfonate/bicarbonate transport system substrate-binding protein